MRWSGAVRRARLSSALPLVDAVVTEHIADDHGQAAEEGQIGRGGAEPKLRAGVNREPC